MRTLALDKRSQHKIETAKFGLRAIREIYKAEGVTIDTLPVRSPRIRAAYFCDEDDFSVLIKESLPQEAKLFALVHELKHHYLDQEPINSGEIVCGDYNANEEIEKGAEVFAAEFIYPEQEMLTLINEMGITQQSCSPQKIVEFKRRSPAKVSYTFIRKRFEWFGLCGKGQYTKVQFQKLEESLYGPPIYKQSWFQERRKQKR